MLRKWVDGNGMRSGCRWRLPRREAAVRISCLHLVVLVVWDWCAAEALYSGMSSAGIAGLCDSQDWLCVGMSFIYLALILDVLDSAPLRTRPAAAAAAGGAAELIPNLNEIVRGEDKVHRHGPERSSEKNKNTQRTRRGGDSRRNFNITKGRTKK